MFNVMKIIYAAVDIVINVFNKKNSNMITWYDFIQLYKKLYTINILQCVVRIAWNSNTTFIYFILYTDHYIHIGKIANQMRLKTFGIVFKW